MVLKRDRTPIHNRMLVAFGLGMVFSVAAVRADPGVSPQSQNAQPNTQGETAYLSMRLVDGTIRDIRGKSITVTTDLGLTVVVLVQEAARIVAPDAVPAKIEQKSLNGLHVTDLRVGDHISVRGVLSDDTTSVVASLITVTKTGAKATVNTAGVNDIQTDDVQLMLDWRKRGVAGVVNSVDASKGIVNISVKTAEGPRTVAIHITKDTILRRADPVPVQANTVQSGDVTGNHINIGDQSNVVEVDQSNVSDQPDVVDLSDFIGHINASEYLQARGARNIEGDALTADEIISGKFRSLTDSFQATSDISKKDD